MAICRFVSKRRYWVGRRIVDVGGALAYGFALSNFHLISIIL